jgi:hypothetical protein
MQNDSDNHPLYAAINRKLASVLVASVTPPAWHGDWLRLGPKSTEEERLAVYRAIRDSECLPADAGFFLVSWQIDAITLSYAEQALREHEERLQAIRKEHGLEEDELWPEGKEPPEYEELQNQLQDAWAAIYAAKLEELGEEKMARLFRTDREEFDRHSEAGREFFHGPRAADDDEETDWLDELLSAVAGCVEADSPMGPFAMRYHEEDGFWEISIYPTPVELVGGRHDGAVVVPGFSLDLERFRETFDSIMDFGWNALGLKSEEGPSVYVEGVYEGREIFLQVLAHPPVDENLGMKLDTSEMPRPED